MHFTSDGRRGRPATTIGDPVLLQARVPGDPSAGVARSRPDVFQQANRGANARLVEVALDLLVGVTQQYRVPVRDALLDAGRAVERPSLLPQAPTSQPPRATDELIDGEHAIDVRDLHLDPSGNPVPRR